MGNGRLVQELGPAQIKDLVGFRGPLDLTIQISTAYLGVVRALLTTAACPNPTKAAGDRLQVILTPILHRLKEMAAFHRNPLPHITNHGMVASDGIKPRHRGPEVALMGS